MKAFKYLIFLLLIAIIGMAIYVAVQPNEFKFSRSRIIDAPKSMIFNTVNDYTNWPQFSPWIEQDPDAELIYGQKTVGVDGNYSWYGKTLGKGSMKTLTVEDNAVITQKIHFVEPFKSESKINWFFEDVDTGTKVTWSMSGKQDFNTKVYTTFMGSIEETTGPDFNRGLLKLDSLIVSNMKKYSITHHGITEHSGGFYIYNTVSCKIPDMSKQIEIMMPKLGNFASQHNIKMAGAPFNLYHNWDYQNNTVMFSCCIPTTAKIIATDPDILTGKLESFKAFNTTLKGDYKNLGEAWKTSMEYMAINNIDIKDDGPMLEAYVNDPQNYPNPAEWLTEIYIAVK